ncbi:MAG TPA: hypothetical protein PKA41_08730, partial [Verrucomicrobiota bacterium]|nr:hypothetical protein [Verrucomicrobiota bacterium]
MSSGLGIKYLVDRGQQIRFEMKKLAAELRDIEAEIKNLGLKASSEGNVEDLKDHGREGRRWLARGSDRIVPVIFTADLIVGSFTRDSKVHKLIEAAAGDKFRSFFKPVNKFENLFDDGKKFRARADELLADEAPRFITACIS